MRVGIVGFAEVLARAYIVSAPHGNLSRPQQDPRRATGRSPPFLTRDWTILPRFTNPRR